MPIVNGKHFAYNPRGRRAAAKARRRLGKKNYPSNAVAMARRMSG